MERETFKVHLDRTNVEGSGKASSYLKALDLLGEMIKARPSGFSDCENVWAQGSIERLDALYKFVCEEKRKGEDSVWNLIGIPKSYLLGGYCSAALRGYQLFLVEHRHEKSLLEAFEAHKGDEGDVVPKLDEQLNYPPCLIEEISGREGKEVVRTVRTRTNQNVFRKIVMQIFGGSCCITGLDVPEVNRASHIIPWSEREETRMDPRNGLYLSATYDAVFDRNLLSLDEDYRIILSSDLKDHYTGESFRETFLRREGVRIQLPQTYLPKKEYLEEHRNKGCF